jgi:glucoamylase
VTVETLAEWIERQVAHAAAQMLRSISPVGIVKRRPGFGQTIRPVPGAVVASPVLAAYDPDPDYFFHWYRDSALVIDALRRLGPLGHAGEEAVQRFADFVAFSLALGRLDGRALAPSAPWRARVTPQYVRYLRANAELTRVHGEAVAADTRVNADGSLDISSWPRPQHDGPPLRALAVIRWRRHVPLPGNIAASSAELLRSDLLYTRRHALEPCYDIWEEELGLHYFTLNVSAQALLEGAEWLAASGDEAESRACRSQAQAIRSMLDGFWQEPQGWYRSRVLASGERSSKELDISVVLSVLQSDDRCARHSVRDPGIHATLRALEALFAARYPINRHLPADRAPALGRYDGDRYYSGGAYYFSTLAAAELCYRAANGAGSAPELIARGDRYLQTVRVFTPASGDMSEQFDQHTGAQTSAKHLAWSYAALISCVAARRAAAVGRD